MKIYFCGAIRGGREKVDDYGKIVELLSKKGIVLTTHVADNNLNSGGETNITSEDIYKRDINWLESADLIVAEVSIASLGVGYELAIANEMGKRVICLFDNNSGNTLSAMISGNKNFVIFNYNDINEALEYLNINI